MRESNSVDSGTFWPVGAVGGVLFGLALGFGAGLGWLTMTAARLLGWM